MIFFFLIFCRKHFTLPHPATISTWISSVEAEPGFLEEVFKAIATFPDEKRDVNVICDAMSIKKLVQYDRKRDKMWGYVDFGKIEVEEKEKEATEVMVFMAACLNGSWRLPVGYFFQDKCSAELLGELIKTALCLCNRAHLRVHSYTCDGTSTNWASLKSLGYNNKFNPQEIQFELKYNYKEVENILYFTPDAVHAAKLARNALGKHFTTFLVVFQFIRFVFLIHGVCVRISCRH